MTVWDLLDAWYTEKSKYMSLLKDSLSLVADDSYHSEGSDRQFVAFMGGSVEYNKDGLRKIGWVNVSEDGKVKSIAPYANATISDWNQLKNVFDAAKKPKEVPA